MERLSPELTAKKKKKVIQAWAVYDWANSVYNLTITSTIFPIYWSSVTQNGGTNRVSFLGFDFVNTALYSYAISFSFLLVAILSPILSGIADYNGSKKRFMQMFCLIGSLSCSSLFWFDQSNISFGVFAFIFGSVGWAGSLVFYNSYLPEIAGEHEQDKVSAKGFAYGYIGSSLLLIANLVVILKPEWFGITNPSLPARISFLAVGIWWFGFAQYTFYHLPKNKRKIQFDLRVIWKGYNELAKVWDELKHTPRLKSFLAAFFFYTMGVQTVMYVAALFGDKELQLGSGQLIATILIIQFVAIIGAYLFAFFSSKFGNLSALLIAVFIWMIICVLAYFVYTPNEFYLLAFTVGMVMGGVQSLSRSTYSKFLPDTPDTTSYFSFYDTTEKIAIVLGTALYGIIEELTGSMRNSVFALMVFFIIGFCLLARLKIRMMKASVQ